MKQANEVLWTFCHCWDSLQYAGTLIAVDTGAAIKACAQSGKMSHTESEKTSCTVKTWCLWKPAADHETGSQSVSVWASDSTHCDCESYELACFI